MKNIFVNFVIYRVLKEPPFVLILGQMNPVTALRPYFFKIKIIILSSSTLYAKWRFFLKVSSPTPCIDRCEG